MNDWKIIKEKILTANNTAIVCHHNPDGDTLGSAFALHVSLKQIDKKSDVLCADDIPEKLEFMNNVTLINKFDKEKYDLVVFLDSGDLKLTGKLFEGINIDGLNTVSIDHHGTNSHYAKINYVDDSYSSCAELVLDLIRYMDINLCKEAANYLYTGIVTDTGQFAYSYTSGRTHENAAYLIEHGAEFSFIHNIIFKSMPLARLLLMKQMLKNVVFKNDNKVAVSLLSIEDFKLSDATPQDSDSLVNTLLAVDSVKVAALIRQLNENSFKISFRSTDDVDVSPAAISLKGGGHKQACGASIECELDQAINVVLNAIEKADF